MAREVSGFVLFPSDAPPAVAPAILVEARDVSIADAPSVVLASVLVSNAAVAPSARVGFSISVPVFDQSRTVGLRCHVDMDGDGLVSAGDYLSTSFLGVHHREEVQGLMLAVRRV
jgi:putative lipoprotein